MKLPLLRIPNGGCFETLNLIHVSIFEMFTFYDVLHETKQKRKQTLDSAQYGLEIIFKCLGLLIHECTVISIHFTLIELSCLRVIVIER